MKNYMKKYLPEIILLSSIGIFSIIFFMYLPYCASNYGWESQVADCKLESGPYKIVATLTFIISLFMFYHRDWKKK